MVADLSRLRSFLPSPPPVRDLFCPLVLELGSLSSTWSDSCLSSPLTSSETLTSSDHDHDHGYLVELTCQMANDTLREQNDEGLKNPGSVPAAITNRDMPRWADLFSISPQPTLSSSSSSSYHGKKASVPYDKSPCENSGAEGDPSWNTPTAYEPGTVENSHKIKSVLTTSRHDRIRGNHHLKPGLHSNLSLPSDGNWTKESNVCLERAPKQANSAKQKPRAKNNQWMTRRGIVQGECYFGLSLPHQHQKAGHPNVAGSDMRAVFLGDPNSRTNSSTGTGVFLPKTVGNPTEQGRKPSCSHILIPARVAQALMVHFSKTSLRQSRSSSVVVGGGGGGVGSFPFPIHPDSSGRYGAAGPNFQQKSRAKAMPEPAINCKEMGLPQEWMY